MADAPDTERQAVEPDAREVLSVSQLNDRIVSVVQDTPALNGVRCISEVTARHQNSAALYFTLTDGDAELPCMLWANRYRKMDVDLEDGTEVILEGDIDYWTECRYTELLTRRYINTVLAGGSPNPSLQRCERCSVLHHPYLCAMSLHGYVCYRYRHRYPLSSCSGYR
ncbi:exodeoxyribonuclease VII large subunit [Halomicroarcula sp. GCM10025817]|uniref:exodeoxyribonuclease VII large subunit n=1 Tax=Haloarcula TaxID=2237 RepID=UPI0023E8EC95|nr:exodeoxyribonuclease VII large subunit [Halomicroarcula sp. SYNS111]